MKKIISTITTITILSLFLPIIAFGQGDVWVNDENLLLDGTEIGEEINLEKFELYWSADTYVPFGYQGRPLPTQGSWVTVNAFLELSKGNPKSLKYSWFLDGIFQESKSGYGKDSFKFGIRKLTGSSHTVLVKAFNESRSFLEERSVTIPITSPEIVVYNKNSSPVKLPYLTSDKKFDVVSDKESSFLALPYFFSIKKIKDLEFEWILGEKKVKDSSLVANVFGLKIINKEVGGLLEETLKVVATNKLVSEQKVKKSINLNIY